MYSVPISNRNYGIESIKKRQPLTTAVSVISDDLRRDHFSSGGGRMMLWSVSTTGAQPAL